MDKIYYENEDLFTLIFQTALALMRERGVSEFCDLILKGSLQVINTEYDNWNGGTYGYTVYINLPVKLYSLLKAEQIQGYEKTLSETLNEVTKSNENHYFLVQISPEFCKSDIEWDLIGGVKRKKDLQSKIETIKNIMISVATGGPRIQDEDGRYKRLQSEIKQACKQLNITYNNNFSGLWDWYGKWKADFPTYQSRRNFINDLFTPTLACFDDDIVTPEIEPIVELDDWERLRRTVLKIKKESSSAYNEEDFQSVGLLCRECIISLAQAVYNPNIHGDTDEDGIKISNTDAVRMISNYLSKKLAGNKNEELRAYAKKTNKLANMLTHERNANKKDMMLTTSATIALINFIGILEDKYN